MEGTKREFIYDGKRLVDFDPSMDPKEVCQHYAKEYPELATANPVLSLKNGVRSYEFKKSAGKKG